jgi:hypothetical protein
VPAQSGIHQWSVGLGLGCTRKCEMPDLIPRDLP